MAVKLPGSARGNGVFVVSCTVVVAIPIDAVFDAGVCLEISGHIAKGVVVHNDLGRAVFGDEREFRQRKAPVDRYEDGAEFPARELDFEEVGVVLSKNGDTILGPNTEVVLQGSGEPTGAVLHGCPSERSIGRQVNLGDAIRPCVRMVCDPIKRACHQSVLPGRYLSSNLVRYRASGLIRRRMAMAGVSGGQFLGVQM